MKSGLEGAWCLVPSNAPGLCWCPLGRLLRRCMDAPGAHGTASCTRQIALGCSFGKWRGRCGFDLCLPLRVSMWKTEEEREVAEGLCEAPLPGEMFCAVGSFLSLSSTCVWARRWGWSCSPPGRKRWGGVMWEPYVGRVRWCGRMPDGCAISGHAFKWLIAIAV